MKTNKFSILVLSFLLSAPIFSNAQSSSLKYMKEIQSILNDSKKEVFQYLKVIVKDRSVKKIESKRDKLVEKIDSQNEKFQKIEGSKLKDAGIKALSTMKIVMTEDYQKIMDIEEISEKSYDNMEAYFLMQEKANQKLNETWTEFDTAFHRYARSHQIKIVESELDKKSQKIKKMSETLNYSNRIYLIYLKCHYQEKYLLEAMEKEDVNAMAQNIEAQKTLLKSSIEKLKNIKPYDFDASMIHSTKHLLKFYQEEVEKDFTSILDFYILKSKLISAKKNYESQKESEKTANKSYQLLIEEYNTSLLKYSETIKKMNTERAKQIKDWFDILKDFNSNNSNIS